MKIIKVTLPREFESVELHTFADEHIGDEQCDMKRLMERIEYVKNTPNAYCILNGDILDNATKTSIGDVYNQVFNPMQQLEKAVELFSPIASKCLCVTQGNHENRTMKNDGINLSRLIAEQLGIGDKYTPTSAVLFIRVGEDSSGKKESNGSGKYRQLCYTMYVLHGGGSGGRKEGSKANRLAEMSSIIDCDIYLHGHTHLPLVMKQGFHRIDPRNSTVSNVTKLYVNNSSNLSYGGYGEAQEFKPGSKDTPVIYLNGRKKSFEARL